jgi:hypothetical protein
MIVGLIMSSCFQILIITTIRSPRRSAGGRNCSAKVARSGLRDCLERHRMGRTLLQRLESRMRSIPLPTPTPLACPHSSYSSPGVTVNEDSLSLLMSMIHFNSYPSMKDRRRRKKKALLLWKSSCLNPPSVESTSMMSCWTLLLPCPTRIFGGWRVVVVSRRRQLSMMWMRKTLPGLNSSTSNN